MILWLSLAFATWVEEDDGFVSSPRSDAPVDGWLLYEANVDPEATVVDGPGAPFVLDAVVVETEAPMAILFPPDGGWEAGASYTVEARGSLTFTVGDAEAPPAVDPEITSIEVGDWSEREHEYVGGCCAQIRPVVVELNLPGGDRWAFSELHAGDGYVGGVRDLSVGSGRHVLRLQQHQRAPGLRRGLRGHTAAWRAPAMWMYRSRAWSPVVTHHRDCPRSLDMPQ